MNTSTAIFEHNEPTELRQQFEHVEKSVMHRAIWLSVLTQLSGLVIAFRAIYLDIPHSFLSIGLIIFGSLTFWAGKYVTHQKKKTLLTEQGYQCIHCNKAPRSSQMEEARKSGNCSYCQQKYIP